MNVLCVVAHPDDEVLGCGATLAKHAENGDRVRVGILGRDNLTDNAGRAAQTLGIWTTIGHQPDQQFETVPFQTLIWAALNIIPNPEIVYTHNPDDLNLDHTLTARAVLTAFRPTVFHGTILAFETISSTEFGTPFQPDWYEVISGAQLEKKIAALECYPSEIREQPHSRNALGIRNRAVLRGDEVCVDYAEAFRLLRRVNA